jgi:hypothetical protein
MKRRTLTAQEPVKKTHNAPPIPNVLVPLCAADDLALLKRPQLARAINVSVRTVDNWQKQKRIHHLPSVLAALRRFEIREAGR